MRTADVLAALRRGAFLQASITRPGIVWSLDTGASVSKRTATAIIARFPRRSIAAGDLASVRARLPVAQEERA